MRELSERSLPRWSVGVLGLLLLVGGSEHAIAGRATPAQKCAGAKAKAFGVAVKQEAQCRAKARKRGVAVDAACLRKAQTKLKVQFAKAEKAGACPGFARAALAVTSDCGTALDGATAGSAACAARKLQAAGKQAAGKSACAKKAALQGAASDACLQKVEGKFAKAVAKADRKGACAGTVAELEAVVDACLVTLPFPIACADGVGHPTCAGACPEGLACRPYEVFANGVSSETGCACVDVDGGLECSGTSCGADRHCADPSEVCERWQADDQLGCDHMICQPAMTTPPTLPPREMLECDGGEFPTCGGTCPDGERCQAAQATITGITVFTGCACVDPRGPRCDMPTDCDIDLLPFSHCADPAKVCLVAIATAPDPEDATCAEAHCGDPLPIVLPPTSTTSTSTTTTTTNTVSTTTTSTSSTSSTSSTTIPCTSTPGTTGCFTDLGDCTILDTCTGLQWEQKQTTPGLHHVDDRHPWAGRCDGNPMFLCQPDAASAATCMALAEGDTYGCSECTTGTCLVEVDGVPTTTVWEWLNQVNGYGFAGHSDWRLPREAALSPTGDRELESILLPTDPCSASPCIDPIFGPTAVATYWSATSTSNPDDAWFVYFGPGSGGNWGNDGKRNANRVRAVR